MREEKELQINIDYLASTYIQPGWQLESAEVQEIEGVRKLILKWSKVSGPR